MSCSCETSPALTLQIKLVKKSFRVEGASRRLDNVLQNPSILGLTRWLEETSPLDLGPAVIAMRPSHASDQRGKQHVTDLGDERQPS